MTNTLDGQTVAAPSYQLREFMTYAAAEGVIERLTDNGYPIDRTSIVGTGLRSVEHVTGRITNRGSALAGAGGGAGFGFLAHRATRGRRDFTSVRRIEAQRYAVFVDQGNAAEAIDIAGLA